MTLNKNSGKSRGEYKVLLHVKRRKRNSKAGERSCGTIKKDIRKFKQ